MGTAINSQLNGFWFYRDQIEEGIRWAEPAQSVSGVGDLDHVLNQFSLGPLLLQQFRGDRGREIIDEALAILASLDLSPTALSENERLHLGELLLAVSTGFSGDRDAARCISSSTCSRPSRAWMTGRTSPSASRRSVASPTP